MSALWKSKGLGLFGCEDGQGMTEYILLVFLIALVCVFGIRMYGGKIKKGYSVGSETLRGLAR
ncbi:MAG: hypothetical protein ABIH68_07560 [bacterium]